METVQVIPLYNTDAIMKAWEYVSTDVEHLFEIVGDSGDEDLNTVFNGILSGHLLLWVVFCNGKYAGFVTTGFDQTKTLKKVMVVYHAYKRKEIKQSLITFVAPVLEAFAKKQNCTELRCYSSQPLDAHFESIGFKKCLIQYKKELN